MGVVTHSPHQTSRLISTDNVKMEGLNFKEIMNFHNNPYNEHPNYNGIFTGGVKACAAGICAAVVFGFLCALCSKPSIK